MPRASVTVTGSLQGQQFTSDESTTGDVGVNIAPSVPAAKTGTLTTRTSNTVGTLTMTAGHGIMTGALLDIYWVGGSQVGCTVGTVSTNSVPFSLGTGDNLPIATTAITAAVPHVETVTVTGDNANFLAFRAGNSPATFHLTQSDNTMLYTVRLGSLESHVWSDQSGQANPIAGDAVGKVMSSHSNSSAAETLTGAVLYS